MKLCGQTACSEDGVCDTGALMSPLSCSLSHGKSRLFPVSRLFLRMWQRRTFLPCPYCMVPGTSGTGSPVESQPVAAAAPRGNSRGWKLRMSPVSRCRLSREHEQCPEASMRWVGCSPASPCAGFYLQS